MILAYGIIAKQNGEYNRVKQELAGLKKQFGRGDD